MRPVAGGLTIPAHGSVQLAPGGYHLMLIGPKRRFVVGNQVPATLRFARGHGQGQLRCADSCARTNLGRAEQVMRLLHLAALLGSTLALAGCQQAKDQTAQESGTDAIGGPFQLADQNGHPVSNRDLHGLPSLVFFGYTYCPEVCPTTLSDMSRWLKKLGPDGDKLQVFYVTVDPERDTAKQLKQYLTAFDRASVG